MWHYFILRVSGHNWDAVPAASLLGFSVSAEVSSEDSASSTAHQGLSPYAGWL